MGRCIYGTVYKLTNRKTLKGKTKKVHVTVEMKCITMPLIRKNSFLQKNTEDVASFSLKTLIWLI